MSLQLIPIEEIGAMIFKQTMTEEVQEHAVSPIKALNEDKLSHKIEYSFPGSQSILVEPDFSYHLQDEALIKCFHLEVLLQPPNC